jgi:hypothetical protein
VVAEMALQEKAAGSGDVAEMRMLVAAGVDVDELGEDEGTALLWATPTGGQGVARRGCAGVCGK